MPPLVVATLNQKGGVGKTTIAAHLAYAASSKRNLRVLAVDFDTQRNLTRTLAGAIDFPPETSAAQLFTLDRPEDLQVVPGLRERIDVLPATTVLDELDHQFSLSEALARGPFLRSLPWDLLIFDTPPALGLRHLAPLIWANRVVVPVEPSPFSVDGVVQTLQTIQQARAANPGLRHAIVINKHDLSSSTHIHITNELGKLVPLSHVLTNRVAVTNALAEGFAVWEFRRAPVAVRDSWLSMCQELTA